MRRAFLRRMVALGLALNGSCPLARAMASGDDPVERWGIFELALPGPRSGNPFIDVELSAIFSQGARSVTVAGFYDGDGVYKVRFMPDAVGVWNYETRSNHPGLNGKTGRCTVAAPAAGNHGPVRVANTFHFAYADGSPYWQLGTTCYAWIHQGEALQRQTLRTLAGAPFNKLRMTVFPTAEEQSQLGLYPFEGTPPSGWDLARFNPAFFHHLEQCVASLQALGIEADLILFHPYDRGHYGFDHLPAEVNERYLRYLVARLGAYRNVWWSMANEFDLIRAKTLADWDRYFQIVQASDPYAHLRSIHNSVRLYDNTKPWVTHASIQNGAAVEDAERAVLYRDVYDKPIVFDEVKYEGDSERRWGQLTPEELVLRFWEGTIAGTYVGHGEIYRDPSGVAWIGGGGTLHGQSPARLAFLRKILGGSPAEGLEPIDKWQDYPFAGKPGEYYLGYFGRQAPTDWAFALAKPGLADGMRFRVDVIDTWNMTITPVPEVFEIVKRDLYTYADRQTRGIALPGRTYMALRIVRVT